ncbi:MAG: SsrA-binding protein SmpB [Victivallales bacterium]|nr:SsrA-binding protein SmpB [Victivallales bacterium]
MPEKSKNIAQNKKARHDYAILDTLEAGIALTGTEVKSCRAGGVSLVDSYATIREGNLILLGTHIAPYAFGNRENHEERRNRRLLVHKKEILRLKKNIEQKGLTLIPLSFYFNSHGRVKVSIGICRGKNAGDKREALKEREDKRDMDRMRKR